MSANPESTWPFGIAPAAHARLIDVFERTPGIRQVWIYGSRSRGDHRRTSDVDLAVDMPEGSFARLKNDIAELELLYPVDVLHLQSSLAPQLVARIERDGQRFWPAEVPVAARQPQAG